MTLQALKGSLSGDVYVLGSGNSLSFIDPRFFDDRVVVATNLAAHGLGLTAKQTYVHSHYHENILFQKNLHPDWIYVTPEGDRGFRGTQWPIDKEIHYYPHHEAGTFKLEWPSDGLIVGSSSIHGSIHLACLLGAENIFLLGADCGVVDGRTNYVGYCDENGKPASGDLLSNNAIEWMRRWDEHLNLLKARLVELFGVRIYSINPFVNLNLEGRSFESFAGKLN